MMLSTAKRKEGKMSRAEEMLIKSLENSGFNKNTYQRNGTEFTFAFTAEVEPLYRDIIAKFVLGFTCEVKVVTRRIGVVVIVVVVLPNTIFV